MKKLLALVLVAVVLLGVLGAISAKARAQEEDGDQPEPPEPPEPSDNQLGDNVSGGTEGTGPSILFMSGVLIGVVVITVVLVVAFRRATSKRSMDILEGF